MIEILYRIYERKIEIDTENPLVKSFSYKTPDKDVWVENRTVDTSDIIAMDVYCCDSRDSFKQHIKDVYGNNIAFANSKSLKNGDLYCIIIGQLSFDYDRYFTIIEIECAFCRNKIKTTPKALLKISDWDLRQHFADGGKQHENKCFCCNRCVGNYIEREKPKPLNTDGADLWVTKEMFPSHNGCRGYIYKISKKSTGEFYIGQTIWLPIWRWGQHLKTERFDYKNILDYQFEVIEKVSKDDNLLEREKYWIQKYYSECPEKSLNISCTKSIDLMECEE